MKALYLETSAVLTWLFGEPESKRVEQLIDQADVIVSSALLIIESKHAILRAELQHEIPIGDGKRLSGLLDNTFTSWSFLQITDKVIQRSTMPFPVEPVRSLDAIHLASMLEFLIIYPDLEIVSFDHRILANCTPLGLVNASG